MFHFFQTLGGELRSLPRGVWVLVAGQFVNRFGSFVFPFFALYLSDRGFSAAQTTSVLIAIALGQMGSPFVAGYLADAIGRRNTILVSLVGGAMSILGLYACSTQGPLLAMGAVHGFFAFMYNAPANALITDLVSPAQRVTAYAVLRVSINAGFAAGPAVAGLLYDKDHALPLFLGDAATTLVFAGLAFALLPHGLRTVGGRVTSPAVVWRSWREAGRDAYQNGPYAQLLLGMLLMAVAFTQVFNVLALDTRDRGLSPASYGMVMGLNGLLIMCLELPLSHWLKRFPHRRVLVFGYAVVALGCASFAWAQTMTGFLLAMALFTCGEMFAIPIASGYGARLAPTAYRGRYAGFQSMAWSLASLAGSAGVWCYDRLGVHWWLYMGGVGMLAAVTMSFHVRDRRLDPAGS